MRVSCRFDPHSHRTSQSGIKRPRLAVLVFQTTLQHLARLRVDHRYLLVARMQITSYNHHRSAPFLRALVASAASKSTRSLGADTVISSAHPSSARADQHGSRLDSEGFVQGIAGERTVWLDFEGGATECGGPRGSPRH